MHREVGRGPALPAEVKQELLGRGGFLFSEAQTRTALEQAGFKAVLWRDDTQIALEWFNAALAGPPPGGLNLGVVMGPDFQAMTANLGRNLRDHPLGVLFSVLIRE